MKKNNEFKFKKNNKLTIGLVIADFLVVFATCILSLVSFYGAKLFDQNFLSSLVFCLVQPFVVVVLFFVFKIYKMLLKDVGLFEIVKIGIVCSISLLIGLPFFVFLSTLPDIRSFIWTWILFFVATDSLLVFIRVFVRIFFVIKTLKNKNIKVRTLVIGAGVCGKIVVDESIKNPSNHNYVVAFADDDYRKIGKSFCNIPIEGPLSNIPQIINSYNIDEVVIAISDISKIRLREIISFLNDCPVRVRRLPIISEMEGPNDTRIIDVDLDDLLCREPVELDNKDVGRMLAGNTVMVTGAGGSIGSELVRQIFKTHPKKMILFDIYENSTYDIQMELMKKIRKENIADVELITLIGSTYNDIRMEQIISKYKPDFIYHAAAYKHVPLMEDSPVEAIRTNVIGTYNVARLADKYLVKKMVLVSTDKAVRPTNVMGATKRFAEMIIQYFAAKSKHTKFAAVRFGNVLGSNGSVVPLFKKQIESGGPITITDKRITRYFMTIPEAVSLILQCGLFASKGEIFILDMGEPIKILNLAERLIRQAGKVPGKDIEIVEIGLRPGEKLYEELLLDKKNNIKTDNKKIFIEQRDIDNDDVINYLNCINSVFKMETNKEIKELLASIIRTYTITENEK